MRYVAKYPLKVGDSWRQPGDEVPEAREWQATRWLVQTGNLEEFKETDDLKPKPVPAMTPMQTAIRTMHESLPKDEEPTVATEGEFDPFDNTVEQTLEYITAHPEKIERVYTLEEARRGRKTLLTALLEALAADLPEDKDVAVESEPAAYDDDSKPVKIVRAKE